MEFYPESSFAPLNKWLHGHHQASSIVERPITPPPSPPQHSSPSSSSSFSNSSRRSSSPSLSLASQWDTQSSSSVATGRATTPKPTSTAEPDQRTLDASQRAPHERFLLIGTISKRATDAQLKRAFNGLGDLLGIYVRFLAHNGVVILAFQDSRSCLKAHLDVLPVMRWDDAAGGDGDVSGLLMGGKLTSRLLTASALRALIGNSPFIADAEARILVKSEAFLNGKILREVLSDYGDVCAFESVGQEGMLYSCEYFDARHARAAVKWLDANSSALGVPLQVVLQSPPLVEPLAMPHLPPQHPPHLLAHLASTTPTPLAPAPTTFPSQQQHHSQQNYSYFPPTPTTPHSAHAPADNEDDGEDEVVMKVAERKSMVGVRRATRFVSFAAPPSSSSVSQRRVTPTTAATPSSPSLLHGDLAPRPRARRSSTGSGFVPGETTQFALEKYRAAARASGTGARVGLGSSDFTTPAIPSTSPALPRRAGVAVPNAPSARALGLGLGLHGMSSLAGLGLQVKETSAGLALVEDGSRKLKQRALEEGKEEELRHAEPQSQPQPQSHSCYDSSIDSSYQQIAYALPVAEGVESGYFTPHAASALPAIDTAPGPRHSHHQPYHYQHTALLPTSASPYALPSPMPGHIIPVPWAQPFGGWRSVGMGSGMPSPSPTTPSSPGMDPATWMRRGSVPAPGTPYPKSSPYGSPRPQLPTLATNGSPRHRNNSGSHGSRPSYQQSPSTPSSPLTSRLPLNARMNNSNPSSPYHQPSHTPTAFDTPSPRNAIDLSRIAAGLDTRTTVMIKNVPSRMTHEDMFAFVSRTCDRGFDFLYLRMDFVTGNNVGYAFVNFMEVGSLLRFLKENLGKRWNMYQSEKTMYAAYATYQGKAALVTKFQNSSILDRDTDVQPHIYHSSGDMKGLPEPFPAPNDSARKARSMAAAQEHGLYSRMNLAARQQMSMTMAAKASSSSSPPSASPSTPTSVRSRLSFDRSSNTSPSTPTTLGGSTASTSGSSTAFGTPFFSGRGSSAHHAASFGRQPTRFPETTTPTRMGRKPRMST